MARTVRLPRNFTLAGLYRFTDDVVATDGSSRSEDFIFDFRDLGWIDGSGLTVFCNTLEWLLSQGTRVRFFEFARVLNVPVDYVLCRDGQADRSHADARSGE